MRFCAVEFSYKFHPWRWMVELGFLWETYISGLGFFMVRFSFVTNSKNEGYLYQAGCFHGWCLPWRCCLYTSLGWNYVSERIWNDLPTSNSHKRNSSLFISYCISDEDFFGKGSRSTFNFPLGGEKYPKTLCCAPSLQRIYGLLNPFLVGAFGGKAEATNRLSASSRLKSWLGMEGEVFKLDDNNNNNNNNSRKQIN